jgi:hypothetical protein
MGIGLMLLSGVRANDPQKSRAEREQGSYNAPRSAETQPATRERLQRITTAVPWPRGVRFVDGKLYALARGVHRSDGGPQAPVEDHAGAIFVVDPGVSEPAGRDKPVGEAVRRNGEILAAPTDPPFRIWDRRMPATRDTRADRPYAALVYDERSRNFFVSAYSGIDLPRAPGFRKNATDAVHRYDRRIGEWKPVEAHDPKAVPRQALNEDVDSRYYPHHDIDRNAPPHGLVNGPCGAVIAGRYLYVGAKDNSALAQYDLSTIREDPEAPPPPARYIFEGTEGAAYAQVEGRGRMKVKGTCAMAVHDRFLYVSFRTTSQILRFPLREDGSLEKPLEADYIAQFTRDDSDEKGGSANIYDMAFDEKGRLYVSPGYNGAIDRFTPDAEDLYDARAADYAPYIDLGPLVGAEKTGNICLDPAGNLYICSGRDLTPEDNTHGVLYRVRPR